MKVLSVKQPWAWLLCSGIKPIENRTRRANFRGRILIHASAKTDLKNSLDILDQQQWELLKTFTFENVPLKHDVLSSIIGSVEIVDCVMNHPNFWAEKGVWNWVCSNPILFNNPIPGVKGTLGIWDYPAVNSEVDENGQSVCMCTVSNESNVIYLGDGKCMCEYCGGKWYK